jgi:hypothetical protein
LVEDHADCVDALGPSNVHTTQPLAHSATNLLRLGRIEGRRPLPNICLPKPNSELPLP